MYIVHEPCEQRFAYWDSRASNKNIDLIGSTKLDLQLWISLSFRSHLHDSHVVL